MRNALEAGHSGIYRYTAKAEMDRTFDDAYQRIDHAMNVFEFYRLVAPAVAHIKCGHTSIALPEGVQSQITTKVPLLPLDVRVFQNGVYVYRDYSRAGGKLEGNELLSINGVSMEKILGTMMTAVTGDGNTTAAKPWRISHGGYFNTSLYGLIGIESPFRLVYRDADGKQKAAELLGMEWPKRIELLKARDPEPQANADLKFLDGGKIAVLTIRSFSKFIDIERKQPLKVFLNKSFGQIHDKGSSNLILDLRDNSGGEDEPGKLLFAYLWDKPFQYYDDLVLNAREFDFFKYSPQSKPIPADLVEQQPNGKFRYIKHENWGLQQPAEPHFGGKVFALINGGSFSTTCEFLSTLHFHRRATFIGEEAAGGYYGNTSGFTARVILPNSRLMLPVRLLTYHLSVSGSKPADRSVIPNYAVTHTIGDLLAGRDDDMELAISLARAK